MSTMLYVHLSLDGKPLAEIPFSADRLQVGRLEENDIVVRDRAASRTHALLEREGEQVYVQDLGSQNGIWLGGLRIEGRQQIGPVDELRIGRHTLRVGPPIGEALQSGEPVLEVREVDMPIATAMEGSTALAEVGAWEEAGVEEADVDPYSIGDEDLAEAPEPAEFGAALSPEALGAELEDEILDPAAAEPVLECEPEPGRSFPGLIVQRSGQLDRILAWDEDELFAGRGTDCQIFLGAHGVSRRHALFVRTEDGFEVRDLDSSNGVFVNGEPVHQHCLRAGDVVRIHTFELTFVLEQEPIGSEIQTGQDVLEPEVERADPLSETLHGQPPLDLSAPDAPVFEEAGCEADEKELEATALSAEKESAAPLVLQLELDPESLPAPLLRALEEIQGAEHGVELSIRVRLKRS